MSKGPVEGWKKSIAARICLSQVNKKLVWADPRKTYVLRLLQERDQSSLLSPSLLFKGLP